MQFTFWFIIFIMLLLIVYQFMPSLQIFVDDKWNHVKTFNRLVDDEKFQVPPELQIPKDIDLTMQDWGNPSKDGPDRSLPGECWWVGGMLHCNKHPGVNS